MAAKVDVRRLCAIAVVLGLSSAPAAAQWLKEKTPGIPRTADGKPDLSAPAPKAPDGRPDLSGIWRAAIGGYEFNIVSDLKPGEILPWAEALYKQRMEEFGKDHPAYRCMPAPGPFYSFGFFKILQTPGVMAVLSEEGVFRQILTDGRRLPEDPNPTWVGYSVGHWDGDTMVVDSAGFNDKTWLDVGGHPHTEALRVTERYRRKDFGHMHLDVTFDDPKAYARPWTIPIDLSLSPDTELLEYVCNENEKDVQHFVVTEADRQKSRTIVRVAPEVLAQYVGTYVLTSPIGRSVTFTVTLDGDQLAVQQAGSGKYPLVAESDTTFSTAGTPVEFVRDAQGVATHFIVHTVEGDQKAVRQR